MATQTLSPLPTSELEQLASNACHTIIGEAATYDHAKVSEWNTNLIQNILQSLISKTSTAATDGVEATQPAFKYIVSSTVIQHIGNPAEPEKHGRRGMHSAVGAYWNNEKDGTYSYKWDAGEKKGMDIVIAITWVAI